MTEVSPKTLALIVTALAKIQGVPAKRKAKGCVYGCAWCDGSSDDAAAALDALQDEIRVKGPAGAAPNQVPHEVARSAK